MLKISIFNAIPFKIPKAFFREIEKEKKTPNKATQKQKSEITIPGFQLYYKTMVTKKHTIGLKTAKSHWNITAITVYTIN